MGRNFLSNPLNYSSRLSYFPSHSCATHIHKAHIVPDEEAMEEARYDEGPHDRPNLGLILRFSLIDGADHDKAL